ncbi:hypothetical protein RIF29_16636 [Crotalaria pallida]|uniref:Uncharacterized protein n=1 Tax=Crotalaria pallida TaxID=3830 RepID=A0AAN9FFI1_CROPI
MWGKVKHRDSQRSSGRFMFSFIFTVVLWFRWHLTRSSSLCDCHEASSMVTEAIDGVLVFFCLQEAVVWIHHFAPPVTLLRRPSLSTVPATRTTLVYTGFFLN